MKDYTGEFTGVTDVNGNKVHIGDTVRIPTENEIHGTWVEYDVVTRGMTPCLLYKVSELGQKLPAGYTGMPLANLYDAKDFMFFDDLSKALCDEDMVITVKYDAKQTDVK